MANSMTNGESQLRGTRSRLQREIVGTSRKRKATLKLAFRIGVNCPIAFRWHGVCTTSRALPKCKGIFHVQQQRWPRRSRYSGNSVIPAAPRGPLISRVTLNWSKIASNRRTISIMKRSMSFARLTIAGGAHGPLPTWAIYIAYGAILTPLARHIAKPQNSSWNLENGAESLEHSKARLASPRQTATLFEPSLWKPPRIASAIRSARLFQAQIALG